MDPSDPKVLEVAFRLLPAAQELARKLSTGGQSEAEVAAAVSQRLKEITGGFSPELEFIAAANWLGRALTINRLDQIPLPRCHASSEEVKVPDLLCIALVDGHTLPCLIEVKRNWGGKIVWTEKYLKALQLYADKLGLPLLVAWKRGHIWTLTDCRHFTKKVTAYHLNWNHALRENLMSAIFGDLLVVLTERISFYLDAEVETDKSLPQPPEIMPPGNHILKIKGAGYLLDGNPITLSNELSWVAMHAEMQNEVKVTGEKTIRVVHTPQPDTIFSLTDLALMFLLWNEKEDEPDWDRIVREPIPISSDSIRTALDEGIKVGVIQYVLIQKPGIVPDFLATLAKPA
jgi:Holliday junction resolvase